MKECMNCKNEFEAKRPHAKFCSDKCRVAYNRAHPQQAVTKLQMQLLYNEMLDLARKMQGTDSISVLPPLSPQKAVALHNAEYPDQHTIQAALSYNELRGLIEAATSSMQLHSAWKRVEKNKELAGWQIKILNQLKENQRGKIDF